MLISIVEEPLPEEVPMPALEESRTELAASTPIPAEVSTRSTRHSELSIAPETPKPVRQPSPEPDDNNDDLFMDNLEGQDNLALPEVSRWTKLYPVLERYRYRFSGSAWCFLAVDTAFFLFCLISLSPVQK